MSTLRERLEAKRRRRVTFPIQLDTVPTSALTGLAAAQNALAALLRTGVDEDDEKATAARQAIAAAQAAVDAHYADVEFQALPDEDFEALADTGRDKDGDLDLKSITPALAAACAVDPDLHDEQWWAIQVADWSTGERISLGTRLFELNYAGPGARVPKG